MEGGGAGIDAHTVLCMGPAIQRSVSRADDDGNDMFTPERHLSTTCPLQDIRLLIRGLCTSQYNSWHSKPPLLPSPSCMLQSILRNLWFPPRGPCFAIQHTILAIAIACKGQPTTPGQREHSPQRHTAAGAAAPTTTLPRRSDAISSSRTPYLNQSISQRSSQSYTRARRSRIPAQPQRAANPASQSATPYLTFDDRL